MVVFIAVNHIYNPPQIQVGETIAGPRVRDVDFPIKRRPTSTAMRPCSIRFLFLLATSLIDHAHSAGLYFPSIPEDPYAFPKYRLSFLNGFSLPNATAQRWLTEGLKGGEAEFLGKEYTSADRVNALSPKAIEPGHPVATSNLPVGGTDSVHSDDVGLTVSVRFFFSFFFFPSSAQ